MTLYIRPLFLLLAGILFSFLTIPPARNAGNPIRLTFQPVFNGQPLQLDTVMYHNEAGQAMSVTRFRFYVSNVSLWQRGVQQYADNTCFLIDASDAQSLSVTFSPFEKISFDEIRFLVGVDSARNISGAQEGALDPVNGMFWAWNTGYIFLKLEGKSAECPNPGGLFEYHIGGFKAPANSLRQIRITGNTFTSNVTLRADAAEVLKTPTTINFKELPSVTGPAGSGTIADNYRDMFSVSTGN